MKQCIQCGENKFFEQFYVKRKLPDGTNQYQSYCKDCYAERQKNPETKKSPFKKVVMTAEERRERRNEQARLYNQKPERKKYMSKYAKENADKEKEKAVRYYQNHKNEIIAKTRLYRKLEPEKARLAVKKWRKANEDYLVPQNAKRRAKVLSVIGVFTAKEWQEQKERQNFICLMCKRKEPEIKLTADHIIPLTLGGTNTIDNIQGLCKSCNSRKHNKTLDLRNELIK
jgi:5-methylcytosine-specific restriction endonuclease McrA